MPLDIDVLPPPERVGVRTVDAHRGALDGSVSSQWYSRPDDQRFLHLTDMLEFLRQRRERSWVETVESRKLLVRASTEDPERLQIELPDGRRTNPNHWSFDQLARTVGAPAGYLRKLPGFLAGVNLQHGLAHLPSEVVKIFGEDGDKVELRAMTSPRYGRVFDAEVVEAILNTIDDTWKVPGVMDWGTGRYDPDAPVSKKTTTLYASDRDCFVFMVRDQYPIQVGLLDNGEPDYIFPGFIVSNSEVGSRALTIETMYLRAVCANRNIWGMEQKESLRLLHREGLPSRFLSEAVPKLQSFAEIAASKVAAKVDAAKQAKIADDRDEASDFVKKLGFNQKQVDAVLNTVLEEEGHPARSLWDVVCGITACARNITHQDERVAMERIGGRLMDRVKV